MEEILASIRRIISDDDTSRKDAKPQAALEEAPPPPAPRATAPATAEPRKARLEPEPEPEPDPADEDVLDLAMAAAEADETNAPLASASIDADTGFDDIAFADEVPEIVPEPEPEPEPEPVAEIPPPPVVSRPPLAAPVSAPAFAARGPREDDRASAARAEEGTLLDASTEAAVSSAFGSLATAIFSSQPKTIEDLTKDLLKPMVKQWLDDNLPNLVERLVREEIERVARGRR